jgi:hypothetical protein
MILTAVKEETILPQIHLQRARRPESWKPWHTSLAGFDKNGARVDPDLLARIRSVFMMAYGGIGTAFRKCARTPDSNNSLKMNQAFLRRQVFFAQSVRSGEIYARGDRDTPRKQQCLRKIRNFLIYFPDCKPVNEIDFVFFRPQ